MSDIDFDELDKAVSSIMSSKTVGSTSVADAPVEEPPVQETAPETAAASESPAAGSEARPSSAAPLAKRRGRFMDVVHPSSDMKSATPAKPQSREGVMIALPASPVNDPTSSTVSQPAAEVAQTVEEKSADETGWPDPLELQSPAEPTEDKEGESPADSAADAVTSGASSEPLSSPFLPDAKVDKRPLGGTPDINSKLADEMTRLNDDASHADETDKEADTVSSKEPTDQPTDKPAVPVADKSEAADESVPASQLPAELDSDLVAIEAGDATTRVAGPDSKEAAKADETAKTDDPSPVPEPSKDLKVEAPSEPQKTTSAVGSIPQQYKEVSSSNHEVHASIYDEQAEIVPLEHLTKKKTGWLYVVLIILALVIGGGGGAAVYFLHLI